MGKIIGSGKIRNKKVKIRPIAGMNIRESFGKECLPSEVFVYDHVMNYSYRARHKTMEPFKQRQDTIAQKLLISRKTVNVAFQRLIEKGIFMIKRRKRRCNLVMMGPWLMAACGKIHTALHHMGLKLHIEKCCIESVRRKYQAMRQCDGGYAELQKRRRDEDEERKISQWKKEQATSTGWGFELFLKSIAGMEENMSIRNRRMARV